MIPDFEIINFQGKRWIVKYKINESLTDNQIKWFKWYKGADVVLRNKEGYFFVQEIEDVIYENIN